MVSTHYTVPLRCNGPDCTALVLHETTKKARDTARDLKWPHVDAQGRDYCSQVCHDNDKGTTDADDVRTGESAA